MADHIFNFTNLGRTGRLKVERLALFKTLFPGQRSHLPEKGCALTLALMVRWRQRLEEFGREGLEAAQERAGQWMRNCPPSFAFRGEECRRLQFCKHRRVCPWCWARDNASDTYDQIEEALFLPEGGKVKDGQRYRLAIRSEDFKLREDHFRRVVIYGGGLVASLQVRPLDKAIGYFYLNSVVPRKVKGKVKEKAGEGADEKVEWKLTSRVLALFEEGEDIPKPWTSSEVVTHRKQLIPLVAKFAAYPKGLLDGPAGEVVRFLRSRLPFRMKGKGGIFCRRTGKTKKEE